MVSKVQSDPHDEDFPQTACEEEPLGWESLPAEYLDRLIPKVSATANWGWPWCIAWIKTGDIRNVALISSQEELWIDSNPTIALLAAASVADDMKPLAGFASRSSLLSAMEAGRIAVHGRVLPEGPSRVIPAEKLRGCDVWSTSSSWCVGSARDKTTVWFHDIALNRDDLFREFPGNDVLHQQASCQDDKSPSSKLYSSNGWASADPTAVEEWAASAAARGVTISDARKDAIQSLGHGAPRQDDCRAYLTAAKAKVGITVKRGRPSGRRSFIKP